MIEIRPSRPDEVSRVKELWKQAFGDGEAYIDFFFASDYHPENMLLLLEDGRVETMLYLMPLTLSGPGVTAKAHYVYALATDPSARKKGFGRQLLAYVDRYLQDWGDDCVTVVPAEPSLHKFFGTVGYEECFSTRLVEIPEELMPAPGPGASLTPIGAEEYNRIRRRLLDGVYRVEYDDVLIAYQSGLSRLSGADLYRVEVDGAEGCAAVEFSGEETVLVKELILPDEHLAQAVAQLARRLPARRYHVRTPACWSGLAGSYIQPFGMAKWYNSAKAEAWTRGALAYMGLAFD